MAKAKARPTKAKLNANMMARKVILPEKCRGPKQGGYSKGKGKGKGYGGKGKGKGTYGEAWRPYKGKGKGKYGETWRPYGGKGKGKYGGKPKAEGKANYAGWSEGNYDWSMGGSLDSSEYENDYYEDDYYGYGDDCYG